MNRMRAGFTVEEKCPHRADIFRFGGHIISAGGLTPPPAIKLYMEHKLQNFQFVFSSLTQPVLVAHRLSHGIVSTSPHYP